MPRHYRWITEGHKYRYGPKEGKGRDDLRGQMCTVITVPRPGTKPANVRVQLGTGELHIVPSGVLKGVKA